MSPSCPTCGAGVRWDYTCHTYGSGTSWWACMGCDSAIDYYCEADECSWGYTHGLNPGNPRAARNELSRPPWLSPEMDELLNGKFGPRALPDIKSTWDEDDDQ